jgi:hypothetical protein
VLARRALGKFQDPVISEESLELSVVAPLTFAACFCISYELNSSLPLPIPTTPTPNFKEIEAIHYR